MKKSRSTHKGFTLIELLMVIAIIGILAGILIPTVGQVKKKANIAGSKAQIQNYLKAIEMFKSEYKYYPDFGQGRTGTDSFEVSLASTSESKDFIVGLTGRKEDGTKLTASEEDFGNRRRISYTAFSEADFLENDPINNDYQIADRFDNIQITLVMDLDGDGFVEPSISDERIRMSLTAYVEEDQNLNAPGYTLWDEK